MGYDFGTTVGIIPARSLYSKQDKLQQIINSKKCTSLNYTVYSKRDYEVVLLQTSSLPVSTYITNESTDHDIIFSYKYFTNSLISEYYSHNQSGCIISDLLTTPIFIKFNIMLLPGCPPGLTLNHYETACTCYGLTMASVVY